uniref:Uncharacterized protein n=1 Tax=Scophthalmus maximus TaxID=52904 RepID=A0A8D3CVN1_SCOMX
MEEEIKAEPEQGDGASKEGESSADVSSRSPMKRARGRPRDQQELVTGQTKRGRGRPKGSLNKKPPVNKVHGKVGRPRTPRTPDILSPGERRDLPIEASREKDQIF